MNDDTNALSADLRSLADAPGTANLEFRPWFIAAADTIERQGKALRAVEALAAKLSREDRFAYASDIYDALERDD